MDKLSGADVKSFFVVLAAIVVLVGGILSVIKQIREWRKPSVDSSLEPSSHVFARVATWVAYLKEIDCLLQATYSRELQLSICTNMVAHARITLCILTFSSVLSAFQEKTDDHFLDFGTGSRP